MLDTRKSNSKYKFELTDSDHEELLLAIKGFRHAKVIISTYDNSLYAEQLLHWHKLQFTAQTRGAPAIETVYFNYKEPAELHDYRYLGDDYKEREIYKNKRNNMIGKFEKMSALERNYFADALRNSKMI